MTLNISNNFIAQSSHVGWGYIFVTAPVWLFHANAWYVSLVVIAGTGAKEIWDAHGLETKELAGNSWQDWAFWCTGVGLALAVLIFSGQVRT
jgi:hypothetical protein